MKFATATNSAASIAQGSCRGNEAEGVARFAGFRLLTSAATSKGRHRRAAFTLVEVLAAMVFMAIVIPVVVEALHISSMSGEYATRKAAAARVADKVLNENLSLLNTSIGGQNGTVIDNGHEYHWTITSQPWSQDATMQLMTAEVKFSVAGRECSVHLDTLGNPQANTQAPVTGTGM
jgi:type II secretory pathway pseudopilin PulG